MAKLTIMNSARDEDCSLRIVPCAHTDTTIAAHIGRSRGMAFKCHDMFVVYACANCHDVIDGRVKHNFTREELDSDKLRALEETQLKLIAKGLIKI